MHIIFHSSSHFPLDEYNMHVTLNTWEDFSHAKGEQKKWDSSLLNMFIYKERTFLFHFNTLQIFSLLLLFLLVLFYSFCCSTKRKSIINREIYYYLYQINKHYTFNSFIFYIYQSLIRPSDSLSNKESPSHNMILLIITSISKSSILPF